MKIVELYNNGEASKFKMPTNWREVSIGQYSKLMLAIDKKDSNEMELMLRSLEALLDMSLTLLNKVPIKQLRAAYKELRELTASMPTNELSRVIEIDGVEYGLIPNFDELTIGEFVDLDNYLQEPYHNLINIFTILYRPVLKRDGDKYIIEDYNIGTTFDRSKIFNANMSIATVYGALVFFCNIGRSYMESTLSSLEIEMEEMIKA